MMVAPQSPAAVRDDLSFELDGMFGPQLLMVMGLPRGWIVKSVKYRGDDVTETGIEFTSSSDPKLPAGPRHVAGLAGRLEQPQAPVRQPPLL